MIPKPGKVYRVFFNGNERGVFRASSGPANTIVLTPIPPGQPYEVYGEIWS